MLIETQETHKKQSCIEKSQGLCGKYFTPLHVSGEQYKQISECLRIPQYIVSFFIMRAILSNLGQPQRPFATNTTAIYANAYGGSPNSQESLAGLSAAITTWPFIWEAIIYAATKTIQMGISLSNKRSSAPHTISLETAENKSPVHDLLPLMAGENKQVRESLIGELKTPKVVASFRCERGKPGLKLLPAGSLAAFIAFYQVPWKSLPKLQFIPGVVSADNKNLQTQTWLGQKIFTAPPEISDSFIRNSDLFLYLYCVIGSNFFIYLSVFDFANACCNFLKYKNWWDTLTEWLKDTICRSTCGLKAKTHPFLTDFINFISIVVVASLVLGTFVEIVQHRGDELTLGPLSQNFPDSVMNTKFALDSFRGAEAGPVKIPTNTGEAELYYSRSQSGTYSQEIKLDKKYLELCNKYIFELQLESIFNSDLLKIEKGILASCFAESWWHSNHLRDAKSYVQAQSDPSKVWSEEQSSNLAIELLIPELPCLNCSYWPNVYPLYSEVMRNSSLPVSLLLDKCAEVNATIDRSYNIYSLVLHDIKHIPNIYIVMAALSEMLYSKLYFAAKIISLAYILDHVWRKVAPKPLPRDSVTKTELFFAYGQHSMNRIFVFHVAFVLMSTVVFANVLDSFQYLNCFVENIYFIWSHFFYKALGTGFDYKASCSVSDLMSFLEVLPIAASGTIFIDLIPLCAAFVYSVYRARCYSSYTVSDSDRSVVSANVPGSTAAALSTDSTLREGGVCGSGDRQQETSRRLCCC